MCLFDGLEFFVQESGKEAALLRLPPLETVHAPLNAHSLSTSRTTRLLFLFGFGLHSDFVFLCQFPVVELLTVPHGSFGLRMNLLMTEQVNQCKIAIDIFASQRESQKVVNL